jgi:hypothetical protein
MTLYGFRIETVHWTDRCFYKLLNVNDCHIFLYPGGAKIEKSPFKHDDKKRHHTDYTANFQKRRF